MSQSSKQHPAVVVQAAQMPVQQAARTVPTTVAAEVTEKLLWFVNAG